MSDLMACNTDRTLQGLTEPRIEKRIIMVCGHSGAGKSTKIKTDPRLSCLPVVDMRSVLDSIKGTPLDNFNNMMEVAFDRITAALRDSDSVIIEGHLFPDSPSRQAIEVFASCRDIEMEYIMIDVPHDVCLSRLIKLLDSGDLDAAERIKRLSADVIKYEGGRNDRKTIS